MTDIIIIGAGTAGLSAAIYALRAGHSVLLMEGSVYGGQIINTPHIANYPGIPSISGYDFATGLLEQAQALGAEIVYEAVTGIEDRGSFKIVLTDRRALECRAVILATGAKNRPLGLPGEQSLIGSGISYCATCDGAFFRDRTVAVVGGGNAAAEDAQYLAAFCQRIYLIHRRQSFRAEPELISHLLALPQVEFLLDSVVTTLHANPRLVGITVQNIATGQVQDLSLDGLFVAIGQMPQNAPFASLVTLDEDGYIFASEDCRTNIPGIFAAGDCRRKSVRQLVTAASDGAIAATAASGYISIL